MRIARATRATRDIIHDNWREGNSRPSAQDRVYEWRRQHPEGRKADCHRDTGLDPKTIRKWWDCSPPAVRVQDGHITVRVSPSQAVSDLRVALIEELTKGRKKKGISQRELEELSGVK